MPAGGRTRVRHGRQRGQSLVEFAISSMVLLLLAMGLIDLSRAFYYSVSLQGAAREGARHGAWFNTAARQNNFLYDDAVMQAVTQALAGAGLTNITQIKSAGCLSPTDGNTLGNKPYAQAAYPATPQAVYVYVCYTDPYGNQTGTRPSPPPDNSWKLGDINVSILMNFQLITPLIQGLFGQGINLAYNEHFTIQGKP